MKIESNKNKLLHLVLASVFICALTVISFISALDNGFVNWDDGVYVYENSQVQTGITTKGAAWAMKNSFFMITVPKPPNEIMK